MALSLARFVVFEVALEFCLLRWAELELLGRVQEFIHGAQLILVLRFEDLLGKRDFEFRELHGDATCSKDKITRPLVPYLL